MLYYTTILCYTVEYSKVPGHLNPADMMTKPVERRLIDQHSEAIGQRRREGRAETAPKRRIQEPAETDGSSP